MLNVIKNRELRDKLIVLLVCLGIYKLGVHVYVPGIDREALDVMVNSSGVLGLMNTFTGGALHNFSIFAVGIMPYITASIIVQLLQLGGINKITEWSYEGVVGQDKIKRLTYVLALVFALIQSFGLTMSFSKMYGILKNDSFWGYLLVAFILTLGTVVLIILGEIIEKKGIGRGISMIILGGIVMMLPETFTQLVLMKYDTGSEQFLSIVTIGLIVLFLVAIMIVVIYIEGAIRKVPIQRATGGQFGKISMDKNYLPIKLNSAGVIPVIFASALYMLPNTISQFIDSTSIKSFVNNYLSYNSYLGIVLYAVLIILFTYFYAFVQIDPERVSKNLHETGRYIPSIRPGKNTQEYLTRVLVRVTLVGSLFLALVSTIPLVLGKIVSLPEGIIFGGTSIIIIVSVGVDFVQRVVVATQKSRYRRFIKNG